MKIYCLKNLHPRFSNPGCIYDHMRRHDTTMALNFNPFHRSTTVFIFCNKALRTQVAYVIVFRRKQYPPPRFYTPSPERSCSQSKSRSRSKSNSSTSSHSSRAGKYNRKMEKSCRHSSHFKCRLCKDNKIPEPQNVRKPDKCEAKFNYFFKTNWIGFFNDQNLKLMSHAQSSELKSQLLESSA